jgi:hypothetical protein
LISAARNAASGSVGYTAKGEDTLKKEGTKPNQRPDQNGDADLLAQGQTDRLGNPLAEPRAKQLAKAKAIQQAEPQEDALAEALVARGDKHGNVNRAANGFRWVGKQALSQPLATAQLTAEQAPLAQLIEQPIQKYTINNTAVREALASFRTQQPFTAAARSKEPYKLGNFQRPIHANLTIVPAQEQENLP